MSKQIPLSNSDKCLVVSDEDFEVMSRTGWYLDGRGYATGSINGRSVVAHRVICPVEPGMVVDHIDRDPLNCTRENLRPATWAQNTWNSPGRRNTSSQYKGVKWHKGSRKWIAAISPHGKRIHLGMYKSEELAARVYDVAVSEHFGEFGYLNFPDEPLSEEAKACYQAALNKKTTSKYTGVMWSKWKRRWQAYVYVDGKSNFIGYFKDEEEAARARDRFIIEQGLTRHKLNFPEDAET